jgi:hypothetical protein
MKTAFTEIIESPKSEAMDTSAPPKIHSAESPSETNPKSEIHNPKFPLSHLPPILRDFATSLAATAEVSPAFAATTCLGVLSASLGAGAVTFDSARRVRPNLYLLTVAPKSLDTATCHRLAYAPLQEAQAQLDQATGPERQPEFYARRAQLLSHWNQIANDPRLDQAERDKLLFQNNLAQQQLALEAAADPHLILTHIPRGKFHAHLLTRPGASVSLVNPDATRPAQILASRIPSHAIDEQTLLAAHTGTPVSLADRTHHLRTVSDPCLAIHWTLPPEAWNEILIAKPTASSPLLPHFLYLKSEACPRNREDILSNPLGSADIPSAIPGTADISSAIQNARSAHSSTSTLPQEAPSDLAHGVHPVHIPDSLERSETPSLSRGIPDSLTAHWSNTIQTLLGHRLAQAPICYPITPEARATLKAFETEIRTEIENCPIPEKSKFIAHHPETAWRLALLLHATEQASQASEVVDSNIPLRSSHPSSAHSAVNPNVPNPSKTDQIRNFTVSAAIALTRFFADQHRQLSSDLSTVSDEALLERVVEILAEKTPCGKILVGQLRDNHDVTPGQAARLAKKFPKLLSLTSTPKTGRGRPSQILSLQPDYPDHPSASRRDNSNISEPSNMSEPSNLSELPNISEPSNIPSSEFPNSAEDPKSATWVKPRDDQSTSDKSKFSDPLPIGPLPPQRHRESTPRSSS